MATGFAAMNRKRLRRCSSSSIWRGLRESRRAPGSSTSAAASAPAAGVNARFLFMDAEAMTFEKPFDVVWSVESISHYQDIPKFFLSAAKLLKPGGTVAITDWFKKKNLTPREHKKFLHDLEHGMMVELKTMDAYAGHLVAGELEVVRSEVLNKNCA